MTSDSTRSHDSHDQIAEVRHRIDCRLPEKKRGRAEGERPAHGGAYLGDAPSALRPEPGDRPWLEQAIQPGEDGADRGDDL